MTRPAQNAGADAVRRLAEEYMADGWTVAGDEVLPPPLQDHRPDLVVRRGDETVVVEVRTSRDGGGRESLQRLAAAVEELPGWSLRVVLLGDAAQGPPREAVRSRAAEAAALAPDHPEAALLLAWSAAEGWLRNLAAERALPVRQGPVRVLADLYDQEVLADEDYRRLQLALAMRNRIAHGEAGTPPDPVAVRRFAEWLRDAAGARPSAT